MLEGQLKTVTHVEQFFGKLGDRKLLSFFDLLSITLDRIVIFSDLVNQLLLQLLQVLVLLG